MPRPASPAPSRRRALLDAVAETPGLTQRRAADALGLSLGRANSEIKAAADAGLIAVTVQPGNRHTYALTPAGRAERARLARAVLGDACAIFAEARIEAARLLDRSAEQGWRRVALGGLSGLTEAVVLAALDRAAGDIQLVGIIDAGASVGRAFGLPVGATAQSMGAIHGLIITDMKNPQAAFDEAVRHFPRERIFTPAPLGIDRKETTS